LPGQRVEVERQRGHQGLALAGLHLGDHAAMQDSAADQLHIEMAHAGGAPAGLPHQGEGRGHDLFQDILFDLADRLVLLFDLLRHLGAGGGVALQLPFAAHLGQFHFGSLRGSQNLLLEGRGAPCKLLYGQALHLWLQRIGLLNDPLGLFDDLIAIAKGFFE
jgi:hypothetical protein